MITTNFERLISHVNDSVNMPTVKIMNDVVKFFTSHRHEEMDLNTIGVAVFGKEYLEKDNFFKKSWATTLGHICAYLSKSGYINIKKVPNGSPIEIEEEKIVPHNKNNEPIVLTVRDDFGRTFDIISPFVTDRVNCNNKIVTIKKTVQPMKKVYTWIYNEDC